MERPPVRLVAGGAVIGAARGASGRAGRMSGLACAAAMGGASASANAAERRRVAWGLNDGNCRPQSERTRRAGRTGVAGRRKADAGVDGAAAGWLASAAARRQSITRRYGS